MTQTNEKGRRQRAAEDSTEAAPQVPALLLQQADAAAAAAAAVVDEHSSDHLETFPPIEDIPPPPYSADHYGEVDISQYGMRSGAKIASDGRVDIKIDQVNRKLSGLLARQLSGYDESPQNEPPIPEGLGYRAGLPCPPLNIVIHVVGSRGDVQPFIALGQVLKNKFNHRVRLATHPVFRDFVTENGLEFFSIGGDPAELMAFMVKNPGLMPGIEALKSGDIGKRRRGIYEIANGCWRSCIEPGDGTGPSASDDLLQGRSINDAVSLGDQTAKPFVADAIISNPPSFAHIHIAEKLGIPLHLMFTMPWSPTQAYPHPLANIVSSNTDQGMTNFLSYIMVDLLTWQGIGDVINRFREKVLHLEPISVIWAPGSLHRLKIPWTYCWSPALIPMPSDWRNFIDIAGFFFLDLASNYSPEPDLAEFLAAGPPPVYIGFGSIVVDDPNAMTKLIFEAVKITGQRALVSKGWGGLAADELGQPENVFMLGNCPHDWLFQHVSAVVHHGGAGTTAAGVKAGRPTVIVPFFGDQPFWGNMVNQAGAGPKPIHHKELTAQKLADAINEALKPESLQKAKVLSEKIKHENGPSDGADSFHKRLDMDALRCSICPGRAAVWKVKKTGIKLSGLAATVLANEGLVEFSDLELHRPREYNVDSGPPEPISGGAAALMGTIGSITAGIADFPSEVLKSVKTANATNERRKQSFAESSTPSGMSAHGSMSDMASVTSGDGTASSSNTSTKLRKENQSVSDFDEGRRGRSPSLTPRSMSTALTSDGSTRQCPKCSKLFSRSSRSATPNGHHRCGSVDAAARITSDSVIGSTKAAANIVGVGLKSPLDFTMSLAKGFHNLPHLYNDRTVRPHEKVTGFQSGIKAASKNFAYGFMDGIGGVVTQPLQGFKEEGGAGFAKGLMKGSLGLVFKPGAAIWGIPAYTMQGVYAEIAKTFGKSTINYIIAARMAQGYDDFQESGDSERARIVSKWKSGDLVNEYRRKTAGKQKATSGDNGQRSPGVDAMSRSVTTSSTGSDRLVGQDGQLLSGFMATRGLSWDERKELARRKEELKKKQSPRDEEPNTRVTNHTAASDADYEEAIRTAVQKTSTNDPEEDKAIEDAIRASVRELQHAKTFGQAQPVEHDAAEDDEAYERAVAASVAEFGRSRSDILRQETGVVSREEMNNRIELNDNDNDDDDELSRVLAKSLQEQRYGQMNMDASHNERVDMDVDTDEDEDFKKALADSMRSQVSAMGRTEPPSYSASTSMSSHPARDTNTDKKERRNQQQNATLETDDDAELQEALMLSEQESHHSLNKQLTEEEIVLEYVKKQSLQEEEYRKSQARR